MKKYVIGVDYGTDSARAIIVDTQNGEELATAVKYYPRWQKGLFCVPEKNQYRQHPSDYLEVFEYVVKEAMAQIGGNISESIVGLSIDTTGSTPVLVNQEGTPLSLTTDFEENPNAMFVLWKDHTAIQEAEEINQLCQNNDTDYTIYEGGIYSSEWAWAKMLHVLREDEKLRKAAYSWVEHCDWLPAILTGNIKPEKVVRSRCAAGHKAMWHESWNGLPSEEFLVKLDPLLKGYRDHLYTDTYTADYKVGNLTDEWAKRLGLHTGVAVGVGAFDCHIGAVGGGIKPKVLTRAIGTSTCDILIASYESMQDKLIPGICGQVDGSVIKGYIGLEAGQSAFGDVYAWFKNLLAWPVNAILSETKLLDDTTKEKLTQEMLDKILPMLSEEAMKISIEDSSIIATDWFNGRRTPEANQLLKGSVTGLTLGSSAPMVFRALVEATAYGSKAIIERFIENGIEIDEILALGGVAKKSPFVMQVLADVMNMPIKIAKTEQTCAVGAAMFASVVAGVYNTVEEAQEKMSKGYDQIFYPNKEMAGIYKEKYQKYKALGAFSETQI